MGAFIVQQPNGRYCRFSTTVDCPTDWNMTREDYLELKAENARRDADFTLDHCLYPFEALREHFMPNIMTEEEFENCLRSMEEEPPEESVNVSAKVFLVHECDQWKDYHYIYGVYRDKDEAIAELLEDYDDLVYDEQRGHWESPNIDNTRYFYIAEETLR